MDVADLKENVQIIEPYSKECPTVKLFFDSISKWDQGRLSKLLMFISGNSKAPENGFKALIDNGTPITIEFGGTRDRMPISHTCTLTLCLPEYETEDELNQKFTRAFEACSI